jgi:hypothetical protein
MNTFTQFRAGLRARVFMAVILGLAAAAMAHHGNPDAPAPAPWSNGPSIPGPAKPQGPGF